MLAFSAAGVPTFGELMDLPASEFDRLGEYALNGPSQVRTQLLLAQIIQLVSGLGGTPSPIAKLLPWYKELTKHHIDRPTAAQDKRSAFMERQRKAQSELLSKRKK